MALIIELVSHQTLNNLSSIFSLLAIIIGHMGTHVAKIENSSSLCRWLSRLATFLGYLGLVLENLETIFFIAMFFALLFAPHTNGDWI